MTSRVREAAVVLAWRAAWRVVRWLPEGVALALSVVLADAAHRRGGAGVRRLEANLARARPGLPPHEQRALVRAAMRSYARYWCDAFRLPSWSRERLLASVRAEGDAPVRAALAQGRGVVMALAHQGNWDLAGAWSTVALARVTTVAERLRPEAVFRAFVAHRESLGMEVLPLGDPATFGRLVRVLRDGGFVPLLADRDLTERGVEADLLGHRARMAAGPAVLAQMTGAALHPVSIWYERLPPDRRVGGARWGVVVRFHPEVVVPAGGTRAARTAAAVQACADALGEGLREHPEDWHVLQRVFVDDLDPRRAAA